MNTKKSLYYFLKGQYPFSLPNILTAVYEEGVVLFTCWRLKKIHINELLGVTCSDTGLPPAGHALPLGLQVNTTGQTTAAGQALVTPFLDTSTTRRRGSRYGQSTSQILEIVHR